jgi:anti-anti-sigma factor
VTEATVTVHTDATTVRIAIAGELDLGNAATVEEQIFSAVRNHATSVVVDLTDLRYLDSSGLRILFLLAGRLELLQISLELVAPHRSPARRVVELSGLGSLVPLRP